MLNSSESANDAPLSSDKGSQAEGNAPTGLHSSLASLTRVLKSPSGAELALHKRLMEWLNDSQAPDSAEFAATAHLHERGLRPDTEALAENAIASSYWVFRRSVPVRSSQVEGSQPEWARGALIEHSIGPFSGIDGRKFWFDFFKLGVKGLFPIYIGAEQNPSLFLSLEIRPRILPTWPNRISVVPGSLWVRADLLNPALPFYQYAGLRIRDGEIRFSQPPLPSAMDEVRLAAATVITLSVKPEPALIAGDAPDGKGLDAQQMELTLPESFDLTLNAAGAFADAIADCRWKVYGEARRFAFQPGQATFYDPQLQRLVFPMESNADSFSIRSCLSGFNRLEGSAPVIWAGWALPLAILNRSAPLEAAGAGALVVKTGAGLSTQWNGLSTVMPLSSPWIMAEPGRIAVSDTAASELYAAQRFELWRQRNPDLRASVHLTFSAPFTFVFNCLASGIESLQAKNVAVEAFTDRPLGTNGAPFPLQTPDALFFLASSAPFDLVYIEDQHLRISDLGARVEELPLKRSGLMLSNALFSTTQPLGLLLYGELLDFQTVDPAFFHIAFGLYRLLPTLPDPYASSLKAQAMPEDRPQAALLVSILWQEADFGSDRPYAELDFSLWPLEENIDEPQATVSALATQYLESKLTDAAPDPARGLPLWHEVVADFGPRKQSRATLLLDVSSRADQLGVAFLGQDMALEIQRRFKIAYPDPDNREVISFKAMHLEVSAKYAAAITLPQISWEPLINISPPEQGNSQDPPVGVLIATSEGPPTYFISNNPDPVPLAPMPMLDMILRKHGKDPHFLAVSLFALPFGLEALAALHAQNPYDQNDPGALLELNQPVFNNNSTGARQLKITAPYSAIGEHGLFKGFTVQTDIYENAGARSNPLGKDVSTIFNNVFSPNRKGVPLERMDVSGYGASVISNWLDKQAQIADISQVRLDVFTGRTAHEIVQARSLIYKWGIRVVRTIKIYRSVSGVVFRQDEGWKAESDGIFDFTFKAPGLGPILQKNPYEFHPGLIQGVFNVKNIRAATDIPVFKAMTTRGAIGFQFKDEKVVPVPGTDATPVEVVLTPVYFTAELGFTDGVDDYRIPARKVLGFIQLSPRGFPIPASVLEELQKKYKDIGGEIEFTLDVFKSGQKVRLHRFDMNAAAGLRDVGALRGTPILPPDGSWSVVQVKNNQVTQLGQNGMIALIREGRRSQTTPEFVLESQAPEIKIAHPEQLFGGANEYPAFLQSTSAEKVLFPHVHFKDPKIVGEAAQKIFFSPPRFADAFSFVNIKTVFPDIDKARADLPFTSLDILERGYQLAGGLVERGVPKGKDKVYLVGSENAPFNIYIAYFEPVVLPAKVQEGAPGRVRYALDAAAPDPADQWKGGVSGVVVGIGILAFQPAFEVKGQLRSEKGKAPVFSGPTLELGEAFKVVKSVMSILNSLAGGQYAKALADGFRVAFSIAPDSGDHAISVSQDLPLLKFPPPLVDNAASSFRMEISLNLGCSFDGLLPVNGDPNKLMPVASAWLELYGRLAVNVATIGIASVYATGDAKVRLMVDSRGNFSFDLRFGFGAEIAVGLPVIGNVYVTYLVAITVSSHAEAQNFGGLIMFKGSVELAGGLVCVGIMIEAQGEIRPPKGLSPSQFGDVDVSAQVTFGLNVSVAFVIDLSFKEVWREDRLIGQVYGLLP